jgi:hypothetical protein
MKRADAGFDVVFHCQDGQRQLANVYRTGCADLSPLGKHGARVVAGSPTRPSSVGNERDRDLRSWSESWVLGTRGQIITNDTYLSCAAAVEVQALG